MLGMPSVFAMETFYRRIKLPGFFYQRSNGLPLIPGPDLARIGAMVRPALKASGERHLWQTK